MVRLFQRVVRSFEVGLVVAARVVCVLRMVLRSVDLLRPSVASFSCTSERASARMSAALSSTPRVSVACRVVVRVGPIVCRFGLSRGGLLLGQPLMLWAAARCDVRCSGSRVDGVLCAPVTTRRVLAGLRSGAAAVGAAPRSQPLLLSTGGTPPTTERTKDRSGLPSERYRDGRAWMCPQVCVRVSAPFSGPSYGTSDSLPPFRRLVRIRVVAEGEGGKRGPTAQSS